MESYFHYVHNLKSSWRFGWTTRENKEFIASHYIKEVDSPNDLERAIQKESDCDVVRYVSQYLDLKAEYRNVVLTTSKSSYVDNVDFNSVHSIINLRIVNNIQDPNQFFRAVNKLLPDAGLYIGRLETYSERKDLIYSQVGRHLGFVLWIVDFLLHRFIPRIPYLDSLYFYLTNGKYRAMSQAEVLGRLVYCGFEIIDFKRINGLSYIVSRKKKDPMDHPHPSYYPIIKLRRVGKDSNIIGVYKLRTMHPYSEYLQDYVIRMNGYNDKGKPANDFRLTSWGMMFRRLWIDEFPQLVNVLKGEMKLVGLRPLSRVRFNEFPEDLQKERVKYKPGCIPPYVALNMPDDKKNIEAERIYLRDLQNQPFATDIHYFLRAVYNIITNKIRSS